MKKIYLQLKVYKSFLSDILAFWKLIMKYNASTCTNDDIEKMQYTLLRENHVIEKGLSLRNPRKGFGRQKVMKLLNRLDKYAERFGGKDIQFLSYPLGVIKHYINYTKSSGVEIPEIEEKYKLLVLKSRLAAIEEQGGVIPVTKSDILNACDKGFESLLQSRHSIRYFSDEVVGKEQIEKSLKLAQKTPSACNRQGWKTHVFQGGKSIDLIKWQGGANGFENEIKTSILVTANLKAFLYYEIHQAYVDGGLYAMNLINALHSLGLGTIPLSCGFTYKKLKGLTGFGIPKNEVPIVIIGVGKLLDNFNVAVSKRKDIEMTNTFH